jgi:hypothetical protein
MAKVKIRDVKTWVEQHQGELVQLTNGNYNIRGPNGSANVGKPGTDNKWDSAQLQRAWGDATGIPKL